MNTSSSRAQVSSSVVGLRRYPYRSGSRGLVGAAVVVLALAAIVGVGWQYLSARDVGPSADVARLAADPVALRTTVPPPPMPPRPTVPRASSVALRDPGKGAPSDARPASGAARSATASAPTLGVVSAPTSAAPSAPAAAPITAITAPAAGASASAASGAEGASRAAATESAARRDDASADLEGAAATCRVRVPGVDAGLEVTLRVEPAASVAGEPARTVRVGAGGLLGAFPPGLLRVLRVEGRRVTEGRGVYALPSGGEVDVVLPPAAPSRGAPVRVGPFDAHPDAEVRVVAVPAGDVAAQVRATHVGGERYGYLDVAATGPDDRDVRTTSLLAAAVSPRACAVAVATVVPGKPMHGLELRWESGVAVEAMAPAGETLVRADAYVVASAGRAALAQSVRAIEEAGDAVAVLPGAGAAPSGALAWPAAPTLSGSVASWTRLPHGAAAVFVLRCASGAAYVRADDLPARGASHVVDLSTAPAPRRVTLAVAGGGPLPPAVRLAVRAGGGEHSFRVVPDATGFALLGMPARGSVEVSAEVGGLAGSVVLDAAATGPAALVLAPRALRDRSVRVVDAEGAPVAGLRLVAEADARDAVPLAQAATDAAGQVALALPAGARVRVRCADPGARVLDGRLQPAGDTVVRVETRVRVRVDTSGAGLVGSVVVRRDGRAVGETTARWLHAGEASIAVPARTGTSVELREGGPTGRLVGKAVVEADGAPVLLRAP